LSTAGRISGALSREERRNYQRQMRNFERGPSLPPAARARAERNAARRAARASGPRTYGFTRRFLVVSTLIAAAVGFVAFSVLWPNMPFAAYVGLAVATVVLAAQIGLRFLQRRVARG
jgi:Flp pilus assembly protein TadB